MAGRWQQKRPRRSSRGGSPEANRGYRDGTRVWKSDTQSDRLKGSRGRMGTGTGTAKWNVSSRLERAGPDGTSVLQMEKGENENRWRSRVRVGFESKGSGVSLASAYQPPTLIFG